MGRKHKKHKSEREPRDPEDEKPGLKLVLKVGGGDPADAAPPVDEPEHHRHHKHKKKKKKKSSDKDRDRDRYKSENRKRRHEDEEDADTVTSIDGAGDATASLTQDDVILSEVDELRTESTMDDCDTSQAEDDESQSVPVTVVQETSKGSPALQKLLNHLHKMLQKKDLQGIFAFPVTDEIAPMYSQIISEPMDFSTMKEKLYNLAYTTVAEFRNDFQLMCTNCMTYNRPDTIYYKAAKKLLGSGLRQMAKDPIVKLKNGLGLEVVDSELDLDVDENLDLDTMEESSTNEIVKQLISKPSEELEPVGDSMTPDEILAQAQAAAKGAADRLSMRQPNSKMGFLRQRPDGTTTLNIINPDNQGIVSEKERVVSLGKLLAKPQGGMGNIAGFKEDKRNLAKPVSYLNYGPFSSYAPIYDTSFATIPKDESDLLLATYGDETGIQYAKSVENFVEEAGDFATKMVDRLLDIITGGEHSKTVKKLEQNDDESKKDDEETNTEPLLQDLVPPESGQPEDTKAEEQENPIQGKLDETADLINELNETQHERLSSRPPMHLAMVQGPSQKETDLANKVTKELTALTKQVKPADVVPSEGVRAGLGMDTEDISDVILDDDM